MALQFSEENKREIVEIVARYPHRPAALLPVLHLAQREFGYLSTEAQLLVAHELDVPPTRVREVVTFYEMYHEHPEGLFHLELCTNVACHLQGADVLMSHLSKKLGVSIGHQTEDGLFSIMEAECLASCGSGPTLRVGEDYYEGLTLEALDALIEKFRALAPKLNGRPYIRGEDGPHTGPVPGFPPPAPSTVVAETAQSADDEAASVSEEVEPEPAKKSADLPAFEPDGDSDGEGEGD